MVYKWGEPSERCSLPMGRAAQQPQLGAGRDPPSSQLHLSGDVTLVYSWRRAHALPSAQHWGFSPALGAFVQLVGNLISHIWQVRKNLKLSTGDLGEVSKGQRGSRRWGFIWKRENKLKRLDLFQALIAI